VSYQEHGAVVPGREGPVRKVVGRHRATSIPCAFVVLLEFKDGARSCWHRHGGPQTLICTDGKGRVVYEDGTTFDLVPGAVAEIPAEIVHWHGADEECDMTHFALNTEGGTVYVAEVDETGGRE